MKLRLINLLASVFAFVILTSCDGKFVPDPIVPVLPKYSSSGYNAAGAMVNGSVWRAISSCGFGGCSNNMDFVPDYYDSMGVEIRFEGQLLDEDKSVKDRSYYFSIFLDSIQILGVEDLEKLRGEEFDLGSSHYAEVYDYGNDAYCRSTEGQIFFDEVIFSGVDYIVSGTFGFIVEGESCNRVEVFSGRFDYVYTRL